MSLATLIQDPRVRVDRIARFLDELDHEDRCQELDGLSRADQRMLYEKAAESAPITLEHFLAGAGPRVEVIHDGRNTLPAPALLRRFQKRFCRPEHRDDELYGYNEGPSRRLIGPGYFVAVPTTGRPHWESRGAVVIDYFQVPEGSVADDWPRIVSNGRGLQRLVYHQTRDFMRRVTEHVSIGAAFKQERPLDHYFVLCRKE